MEQKNSYVKILNAKVFNGTIEEMVDIADKAIQTKEIIFGTGINLNQLYLMKNNSGFANAIEKAILLPPDGTPIMWIAKWMGSPLKSKIVGPDYTLALCQLAAKKGYSVYILGGKEGSAEKAIGNMHQMCGQFKVAGYYCPPFGFENDETEINKIVTDIRKSQADILLMCLSAPKQELFVEKYRYDLSVPVIFGAGIAIDYFADRVKRSPEWVNKIGLEWFYRMLQEPKRLIQRYIIDDLPVLIDMWKWARTQKKNRTDV